MSVIKIFDKIPENIFNDCLKEVESIDWNDEIFKLDPRRDSPVFKTSLSEHLRVHSFASGVERTRIKLSGIIECQDTSKRERYKSINTMIDWILEYVSAVKLGRIMIVNLLPNGEVPLHIDEGKYFENYCRFHVPVITNEDVLFFDNNEYAHMPVGFLSQLNNRNNHGVKNNSSRERIHIIVDIQTVDERFNLS